MPTSSRIIPTLLLKPGLAERFETGISERGLQTLTHVSPHFDEILNRAPNRQAPYVGSSAFATKAGIHASAILKAPETYEHVRPETVGNQRRVHGLRPGGPVQSHRGTGTLRPAVRSQRSAARRTARRDQGTGVAGLRL